MELIVYSLPHCMQCSSLKRRFLKENIDFEEVINEDLLMNLSRETGIMTAPIVEDEGFYFDYHQIIKKCGI